MAKPQGLGFPWIPLSQARLLLVGEGILRANVERRVAESKIDHAVRFLGLRNDVPRLMTLCDVLLFPSLQEGFPLVALEAGGAELPVVASKIPAMSEAIQDGVTGILHALDDLPGMADSVVKLLLDQSLRRRLGRAGRGRVQQEFSTSGAAHRLLSLYGRLISRPR